MRIYGEKLCCLMFPAPKKRDYLLINELHSMRWLTTPLKIESNLQSFTDALLPEQNELKELINSGGETPSNCS